MNEIKNWNDIQTACQKNRQQRRKRKTRNLLIGGVELGLAAALVITLARSPLESLFHPEAASGNSSVLQDFGVLASAEETSAADAFSMETPSASASSGESTSANVSSGKTPSPVTDSAPQAVSQNSDEDWNLILVNRWNPIPEHYEVTLTELMNQHSVDSRIYPELQQMFDDARAQGITPMISSSYRTTEMQQELLDEKLAEYRSQGYSDAEAKELAEAWVAVPGTSEHQLGIAVDITTADSSVQDASIVWDWLNQNSFRYGFILRYPEDKTEITGVIYEPWHFRYVGQEDARKIYEQGVCLEEYLGHAEDSAVLHD